MAILHLICGLPGSGKSTLARDLESQEGTIWLSADEWVNRIIGDGYDEQRRKAVEDIQWETSKKLLELGVNVVLDNGFWSRSERAALYADAKALGAQTRLHVLDLPLAELKRRISDRNQNLPIHCFRVTAADLDAWDKLFERPDSDEIAGS